MTARIPVFAAIGLLAACRPASEPAAPGASGSPGLVAIEAPPPPSDAAPTASPSTVIPAEFQGEWNARPDACGSGMDDSRLRIAADELQFYESRGKVRDVAFPAPGRIAVAADMSGEGQTWSETFAFALSQDGQTLTDAHGFQRSRCPTN